MYTTENFPEVTGPFCDISNRSLILQLLGFVDDSQEENLEMIVEPSAKSPEEIVKNLEAKGQAFTHTHEYFAAIKDLDERKKAYQGISVSTHIPSGSEADIIENPFKYLNLPEDATFSQTHSAWITLSKIWYPDMIYPEDEQQRNMIFGTRDFSLDGEMSESWFEDLQKLVPPPILDKKSLESLTNAERAEYLVRHEEYREKKQRYEGIKAEMREYATTKMQIINNAYEETKKRFSQEEVDSFAGFSWQTESLHQGRYGTYNTLKMEGHGEIRADHIFYNFPTLVLDASKDRMGFSENQIPLQPFFAWMELTLETGLSPFLLQSIEKVCKFSNDQAEQLRLMLNNKESANFILDTLGLDPYVPDDETIRQRNLVNDFIYVAYHGPVGFHQTLSDKRLISRIGVELTDKGGLNLHYKIQDIDSPKPYDDVQAQFTPLDMNVMRAIAYGPLIQTSKTE